MATHFRPLKGVIDSVDDQPPLIDDVVAALAALANELQTVKVGDDPNKTLQERGGLGELVGAVADVAVGLPDPIDDWIAGIAQDTSEITREAMVAELNAHLQADVLPFCHSATDGRYPFDQASTIDVTVADFQRLFGPGGIFDEFTNNLLLPYVNTTTRPWLWRADFGLPPETLQPFEKARSIRDALFPGGLGPVIAFTLEPKDLSANAARVTLNVDGQLLVYFNAATRPMPMTWPGTDGTNLVSLSFTPLDGSTEEITTETGGLGLPAPRAREPALAHRAAGGLSAAALARRPCGDLRPSRVQRGEPAGPPDVRRLPVPGEVLSREGYVGLWGKLPATGDFISRGLPDAFRARWDAWVTRHLAALAEPWPAGGLRFRLVSGGQTASGLVAPSRDAAGRSFPFTALVVLPFAPSTVDIDRWCDGVLPLLIEAKSGAVGGDDLWRALDALPRPSMVRLGPDAPLLLWTAGQAPRAADPTEPDPALSVLFSSG
ncbi:IcmF-related protein [Rubellimicrobium mesophilum DSM 19309]|uniref:IcmF-related protein n=1 Tax=Rubellimicrobium mesophilum DSM 19309 TaxID=442562 RepID=A0A017HSU6_9RHOB|nr:type VI secretion system-associated protein TagF [Rubellimicrobium mesophilum]EYD77451.1 IcmF-related protein [Rubellimicrobium mesophilum DSM 19309]